MDKSRDDLAAFAKLVGWPLVRWQAASLGLEARTTYVVGPRQSGKSRSAALVAGWRAFREPCHHVLIVSASELGAKRLLAVIADLVVNSDLLAASVVDEQASLIRLTNGSTIRSVPASVKAIRGWSIDTLIFDEATELGDEIIDLATPTTAARPDARVLFLSTAGAPVGRAYETFMAGLGRSDLVRSYSWRLRDAKWISKAAIEHARLTLPPWRFQSEYESEWLGSVDALFPPDLLRRCTADLELPDLEHLRGPCSARWQASAKPAKPAPTIAASRRSCPCMPLRTLRAPTPGHSAAHTDYSFAPRESRLQGSCLPLWARSERQPTVRADACSGRWAGISPSVVVASASRAKRKHRCGPFRYKAGP